MKKRNAISILVLIMCFIQLPGCLKAGTKGNNQEIDKTEIIPQAISPEETLKIYLNAFISRDIDTVMAYLPNGTSKEFTAWRERAKAINQTYMSDKKHIKAIDSIKLIKIETIGKIKRAIIEAVIITTPNFSGAVTCDEHGKCNAILQWTFRQYKQDAPWLYDGGGF